jgi:hypothetical protein
MSTYAYRQVLDQVQHLTPEEQLQLLGDLAAIVQRYQILPKPLHSILELEGLGKEIWEGIDVDKYIEQERNSWNG